jgi:hypothetical protein
LSSYWIDNLGFITEGKLAAIFIKTFSWGFPTGRLFTTHFHIKLVTEVSIAVAVYLRRNFHTIITMPPLATSERHKGQDPARSRCHPNLNLDYNAGTSPPPHPTGNTGEGGFSLGQQLRESSREL